MPRPATAFALLLAACAREPTGDAVSFDLALAYAPPAAWLDLPADPEGIERAGEWVALAIPNERWRSEPVDGVWTAFVGRLDRSQPIAERVAPRLTVGELEFEHAPEANADALPPTSSFQLDEGYLRCFLVGGGRPEDATLRVCYDRGHRRTGRWHVALRTLTTTGFAVAPGEPVRIAARGHSGRLSFATSWTVVDELPASPGDRPELGPPMLRVRADDAVVFERTLSSGVQRHEVELDAAPDELRFELVGDRMLCAIHTPRIDEARRAVTERPDLVLVLADTFRADNLTSYGGEADVTPHLDRFADASIRFDRAWAPAAWTLPSQSSMMLAVHPPEHGAVREDLRPPFALRSLADQLATRGYRTIAVTESQFLAPAFGMRGFEWFEEHPGSDAASTFERAAEVFAERDGRPTFLFLQTYHTHNPYEASDEVRAEHGARLGVREDWETLYMALVPELRERMVAEGTVSADADDLTVLRTRLARDDDWYAAFHRIAREALPSLDGAGEPGLLARFRALYLAGSLDLDRAFGRFVDGLHADGYFERGFLLFTSDHGEALGEHDNLMHGQGTWNEVLRVPLLLRGPGLAARVERGNASLIDLPRTFCALADVAPHPEWRGRNLLEPGGGVRVYAFDCAKSDQRAAVIDGDVKWVFRAGSPNIGAVDLEAAFDLGRDPEERSDLTSPTVDGEDIDLARAARFAAELDELSSRRHAAPDAPLPAWRLDGLEALGYAGDGR